MGAHPTAGDVDEAAFAVFAAERLGEKNMRRFARAFHVPEDVAADMTQAALLSLWQRAATIAQERWGAWFFRTMLRGVYAFSRAQRRAKRYEPAIALEVFTPPDSGSPEAAMHLRQCELELHRLVALLRAERRAVVQLYLLDERPMKEVAAQLGVAEDTAKNRWRLAQMDMAKAFGRKRAKERFLAAIAVFAAFLAGLRRRAVVGGPRRAGPLLACAALALVVASHHGEPATTAPLEEIEPGAVAARFEYHFSPALTAFAERERAQTAPGRRANDSGLEVARVLLAQANAALRDGRTGVARAYLAQYKAAFPRDPDERSARQYVAILAELASRSPLQ